MTGSKDARKQVEVLKEHTCYDMEFPGSVLKSNKNPEKVGVFCDYEVKIAYPITCELAKVAFPASVSYEFIIFPTLKQKTTGDYVDIIGYVTRPGHVTMEGSCVSPTTRVLKPASGEHIRINANYAERETEQET